MVSDDDLLPLCVPENSAEIRRMYVRQRERIAELEKTLEAIANQAHHGGLLPGDADSEIRRLSLPYWNKAECDRLQYDREVLAEDIRREREDGRD